MEYFLSRVWVAGLNPGMVGPLVTSVKGAALAVQLRFGEQLLGTKEP